jgi:hypothetical protein
MNNFPELYELAQFLQFSFTYLSANFRDHKDGVAQKGLALHSAWSVCVRLLSGGRNAFIFDFCPLLGYLSFLLAMNVVHRLLKRNFNRDSSSFDICHPMS